MNFENHRDLARKATSLLAHRGPDAAGTWSSENISLAHRRLSIIDLSERSNQPFKKDHFIISYNGEIYNYRSIRSTLELSGSSFITDSDTEIILEAFRKYGASCVNLFEGMFAFAIWNENEQTLFLARDPLGIKPLYIHSAGKNFAFGSELKPLAKLLPVDRKISAGGLAALFTYLWLPPEFCILEGFAQLPPGAFMFVDRYGKSKIEQYWQVEEREPLSGTEGELCDLLDATLNSSIDQHIVSDVEVGAFLSGGLDSSLICALAAKRLGSLQTYTIGTTTAAKKIEQMPSDEIYARRVADLIGAKHHEIVIEANLLEDVPRIIDATDEPIGDPAILNTRLICDGARQSGVKVLLSGMGADEIFFGYRRQKAWLYSQAYQRVPSPLRYLVNQTVQHLPVKIGQRGLRSVRWAKKFLSFAELSPAHRYQSSFSYYSRDKLSNFLAPKWAPGVSDVSANFEDIFGCHFKTDPINRLCYTDTQMFLPGLNLAYTDRASMAVSTEVRVPFVTKQVVELAMRLPGNEKFKHHKSKHILKRVAERYLPKDIVHRPKASFGAPIRAWISNDLRPMVDDLLSKDRLKKRGWVDPSTCLQMIEDDRRGRADYSYQIYQLLILELWAQSVLD